MIDTPRQPPRVKKVKQVHQILLTLDFNSRHREHNISAADFFSLEILTLGMRSRIYQQLRGPRTLIGFAKTKNMDLYIPSKCSAINGLITSKDHTSVRINFGHLVESLCELSMLGQIDLSQRQLRLINPMLEMLMVKLHRNQRLVVGTIGICRIDSTLEHGWPVITNKRAILGDVIRVLNQLEPESQESKEMNEKLLEEIKTLKVTLHTFAYKNKQGHRSAIRISNIVSETLRIKGMENVRWFVMVDDDTAL
ncbi:Myc-type, basic helix-loop-helix domain-containing protein [Tanacetum coccineum]